VTSAATCITGRHHTPSPRRRLRSRSAGTQAWLTDTVGVWRASTLHGRPGQARLAPVLSPGPSAAGPQCGRLGQALLRRALRASPAVYAGRSPAPGTAISDPAWSPTAGAAASSTQPGRWCHTCSTRHGRRWHRMFNPARSSVAPHVQPSSVVGGTACSTQPGRRCHFMFNPARSSVPLHVQPRPGRQWQVHRPFTRVQRPSALLSLKRRRRSRVLGGWERSELEQRRSGSGERVGL
jgi:hypothetical protein